MIKEKLLLELLSEVRFSDLRNIVKDVSAHIFKAKDTRIDKPTEPMSPSAWHRKGAGGPVILLGLRSKIQRLERLDVYIGVFGLVEYITRLMD